MPIIALQQRTSLRPAQAVFTANGFRSPDLLSQFCPPLINAILADTFYLFGRHFYAPPQTKLTQR